MDTQPSHHEQIAAIRRAQILDAATSVFAARGFHRTTIRDIAREAGVADGTIYNYFANKPALLLGILERLNESERRESDMAQAAGGDLRSFLEAYARQRLTVLADQLAIFQVVLSEVLVDAELRAVYLNTIIAPTFALAEERFARMAEAGIIQSHDIALSLRVSAATTLGLVLLRLLGDAQVTARWDDLPALLAESMYTSLRLEA